MTSGRMKLARAIAVGFVLCGLTASPALADRDHHGRRHWKHKHKHRHRSGHEYYYYAPERRYYYVPAPEVYYVPPPVYVPPPPPGGISLIFPFHFD